MTRISVRGYAKLNLALAVTGTRPDGYHLLDTVMRTVSLYDEVAVERTEEPGVRLLCADPRVPQDGRNTAVRAAERYIRAAGMPGGVRITVCKRIPLEAGMGGSSADAAAVLNAMQTLWRPLPEDELTALAASIGADVPFQLCGGLTRCTGIGDRMEPLPPVSGDFYVVCKPPFGIRTPDAFAACDRLASPKNPDVERLCGALRRNDLRAAAADVGNLLEQAVDRPEIEMLRTSLPDAGALAAAMTGSGSAVFGLFLSLADAEAAAARVRTPPGTEVMVCGGVNTV